MIRQEIYKKTRKIFSGYSVFAGCFLLMVSFGGLLSHTSGLFMYPICTEFGFSTTAYSITNTVGGAINAIVSAFFVQYLSYGNKRTMNHLMLAAAVISCGGFTLMSQCSQLWQFYLMSGVWNLGYSMLTFTPVSMLISNWFIKDRALMTGVAFAGSNLGGAISNAIVSHLISVLGWRFAYILGGSVCFIATVIAICMLKRSPAEFGQKALTAEEPVRDIQATSCEIWVGIDKSTAMRTPAFYVICVIMFLTGLVSAGVSCHVITFLCSENWEITEAGAVMATFTLSGIFGNSGGGAIVGKIGIRRSVYIGSAVLLTAMGSLILCTSAKPLAYIWAIGMGISCFVSALIPSLVVSSTFGAKDYAGIYGCSYAFFLVGCAFASPFVALIAEHTSYTTAWIVICAIVIAIVALHTVCQSYGTKLKITIPTKT